MALFSSRGKPKPEARALQRRAASGALRAIHHGLYTDDLTSPLEDVTRRELLQICAALLPGAVISHRSAIDMRPTQNDFFLTGGSQGDIELPGVRLRVSKGSGPLPDDIAIPTPAGPIHRSCDARAILENLQPSRARSGVRRTLGQEGIEAWLDRQLAIHGAGRLNGWRDQARALAETLKLPAEMEKLEPIMGSLLGTGDSPLKSPAARARAAGEPYDAQRIDLFDILLGHLRANPVGFAPDRPDVDPRLQAFVESYFSNYIEGTEFELREARDIVLGNRPMPYREDDSHDVIGVYRAVLQSRQRPAFPATADEFIEMLRGWNRSSIFSRASKNPGEFKETVNRFGTYEFVQPELVRGTLRKSFELIMAVGDPAARAVMSMFVVSEVHPFLDGNGRTARLCMNAAASVAGLTRLIVATAHRDDYRLALRTLSANRDPAPYVRFMNRAAAFSAWLETASEERCFGQLRESSALMKPNEGVLRF